ncbi:MAG TPA: Hsp20/alpha crystallin family protein [Terriglobia bacterium]|nr:Hsp20/alpha crystallin family protein [Terriglobia bacterium]
MKIVKTSGSAPAAPLHSSLKPEGFFDRMKEFEDSMLRRVYELFGPAPDVFKHDFESFFRSDAEFAPVPIELTETEDGYIIHAEVPGFKEKEVELRVEPRRIFIGGQREAFAEEKKGKTVYSERRCNQIARWLDLPTEINPDKVKATLSKGLLEITLHKAQPAKKVPIEVKAA